MTELILNDRITNYLIDEMGNVYNKKTKKYLKGSIKNGYKTVKLTTPTEKKDYLIHRLVAKTFIKNEQELPQVNHIDGNKLNNCVDNLEWVSSSENILHSWQSLNRKKRRKNLKIEDFNINISEWKQYFDTNYYVNENGECINMKTKRYLIPSLSPSGYLRYNLYINQKHKSILAQILVYNCFYPLDIIDFNEQINHKDGNKQNNNISNLEKITRSQNMQHSFYCLSKNVQPIKQYDLEGNLINRYSSINEASRILRYPASGLCLAVNHKIKIYKGYKWDKE